MHVLPPCTLPPLSSSSVCLSSSSRLSRLWLSSGPCGGSTSVSWPRTEPCCVSSPASRRRPPCRRQRTSDPSPPRRHHLSSFPPSLSFTSATTPLSCWCVLCSSQAGPAPSPCSHLQHRDAPSPARRLYINLFSCTAVRRRPC